MSKIGEKWIPPLMGEAFIIGILLVVAAEVSALHHFNEWRDDLIKSGTQTGHSPPSPSGGGGGNPEVLVVGSLTAEVGNLHYYPRL